MGMGKILIILSFLFVNQVWASPCDLAFISEPKIIYTQDIMPIGEYRMDEALGYSYHLDEHVLVAQLDLGPGLPRPFLGVFADDGTKPDLKDYHRLIHKHGKLKAIEMLIQNPSLLLSNSH